MALPEQQLPKLLGSGKLRDGLTVHNTFLHCFSEDCGQEDCDEQPMVSRAKTAPAGKEQGAACGEAAEDPDGDSTADADDAGEQPRLQHVVTGDLFEHEHPWAFALGQPQAEHASTTASLASVDGSEAAAQAGDRRGKIDEEEATHDALDVAQPALVRVETHDFFESQQAWGMAFSAPAMPYLTAVPQSLIQPAIPSQTADLHIGPEEPGDCAFVAGQVPADQGSGGRGGGAGPGPDEKTGRDAKVTGGGPQPMTTVMLRNLPNNYTRDMLLSLIDSIGFAGRYDFLYFPIDFRTRAALGYGFLNLLTHEDAEQLREKLDGFTQWSLPSGKVCSVGWSNPHQGLESHIARYRNSPLMHEDVPDEYRPVLFENGVRVPFPPTTKKVKPPRQGTQRMLV